MARKAAGQSDYILDLRKASNWVWLATELLAENHKNFIHISF